MTFDPFCIDCNWAYEGFWDSIALIFGFFIALWVSFSGAMSGEEWEPVDPPDAADTADDIGTGVHEGGTGTGGAPTPAPSTTPPGPTPTPPPGPGVGQQFWDIIGHDLGQLGRQ